MWTTQIFVSALCHIKSQPPSISLINQCNCSVCRCITTTTTAGPCRAKGNNRRRIHDHHSWRDHGRSVACIYILICRSYRRAGHNAWCPHSKANRTISQDGAACEHTNHRTTTRTPSSRCQLAHHEFGRRMCTRIPAMTPTTEQWTAL